MDGFMNGKFKNLLTNSIGKQHGKTKRERGFLIKNVNPQD
jgi:hypothetical protein